MPSVYVIYLITNTVNGMIYVGRTTRPLHIRWNAHKSTIHARKHKHLRLYVAMRRFGIGSFRIEQIDSASSFEELKNKEREHILTRKSHLKEVGYNMSTDTSCGLEFLDESSLQRRSESIHKALASKRRGKHGVGVRQTRGLYYGNLVFRGARYSLPFATAEDAALAVDRLTLHLRGDCGVLNYPNVSHNPEEIAATVALFEEARHQKPSSEFWGVAYLPESGRFRAHVCKGRKTQYLGSYLTEAEAALAADKGRAFMLGAESKHFNFPDRVHEYAIDREGLGTWFDSVTVKRSRGLNYDARIERYGVIVATSKGAIGLGYYEDPVRAAEMRDMGVVFYGTGELLNYPENLPRYERDASTFVTSALEGKVHGKRTI